MSPAPFTIDEHLDPRPIEEGEGVSVPTAGTAGRSVATQAGGGRGTSAAD